MTVPTGLGAVLAVIVLVLAVVMGLIGQLELVLAVMFGLLAVARLV